MIAALAFGPGRPSGDGRTLRAPRFELRSTLPLSAACLVANGVREALGRMLAREMEVTLLEAALPAPEARRLLFDGAAVRRVRGRACDAFVLVRPRDARCLVAAAFGEPEGFAPAPLSPIERQTLDRVLAALVPLCTPLCGTQIGASVETPERAAADAVTYFEVRTTNAPQLAIGFALSADPREETGTRLELADLADIELPASIEFARGSLEIAAFARLAPGMTIPLATRIGRGGVLRIGGVAFASGTCGVRGGRHAFDVDRPEAA